MVGDWTSGREPARVVEPGNVEGRRRRGDYDWSRGRAGGAGRGGGRGCGRRRGRWRRAGFLFRFGLDLKREKRCDVRERVSRVTWCV